MGHPREMIPHAVDAVLEASVIGSFTWPGHAIRSRLYRWEQPEPGSRPLAGKSAVITGATSGLGRAAASELAELGASVHIVARDPKKASAVCAEILAENGNSEVRALEADLAVLDSVRELACTLREDVDRLDLLVHNAGALNAERTITGDSLELTFQVHVVAPFLLTAELLPPLAAARGRIVTVTSGGMYAQSLAIDDLQSEESYRGSRAYARAKRAQVLLTQEWAHRLAPLGISAHAMHPGWVDTPGVAASLPRFHRLLGPLLRTPRQGVDTIVWLATAPEQALGSGRLWHDRRVRSTHRLPWTRKGDRHSNELWERLGGLAGCAVELPG